MARCAYPRGVSTIREPVDAGITAFLCNPVHTISRLIHSNPLPCLVRALAAAGSVDLA